MDEARSGAQSVRCLLVAVLSADVDRATALRREIALAASHLAAAEMLLEDVARRAADDTGEAA